MRTATKWLVALGLIGAAALSVPNTAAAQGFYLNGPGFGVGLGTPYYGSPYYGYYNQPYGYYAYGRFYYGHRYRHWRHY